jgi:hypothetical protein
MKAVRQLSMLVALTALITLTAGPGSGQPLTGASAAPEHKYSTPMPPGIAVPFSQLTVGPKNLGRSG